jgi:hypothetical protein
MLLTSHKLRQSKPLDIENELRGTLRNFGLKVGTVSKRHFEARTCELARRLAVILHRMWVDGSEFRWGRQPAAA